MFVVCIETGESFGSIVQTTRRVSGRHRGTIQAVTTDRVMEVRSYPKRFVAFYNISQQRFESKFVTGTFKVVGSL